MDDQMFIHLLYVLEPKGKKRKKLRMKVDRKEDELHENCIWQEKNSK